ncbi:hypothetical protein RsS62_00360 [Rhizobium dioscoreae]|uniref:Uncharacterized protein n=1 Tax=Rhizobium dioscoreae TaxID=2653122 RepID=A0ABQ0Z5U0_9HYPH|nr:hypothetical protein RsS62_00360 [Rhizobium dioscoreae]GES50911.1 hypothetical protein RsS93_35250 [Rhizobium dioscoreae]GLU82362.1 hypothetical protein Rhsp01_35380 [Rhizobium sp. NBRC 114257]
MAEGCEIPWPFAASGQPKSLLKGRKISLHGSDRTMTDRDACTEQMIYVNDEESHP